MDKEIELLEEIHNEYLDNHVNNDLFDGETLYHYYKKFFDNKIKVSSMRDFANQSLMILEKKGAIKYIGTTFCFPSEYMKSDWKEDSVWINNIGDNFKKPKYNYGHGFVKTQLNDKEITTYSECYCIDVKKVYEHKFELNEPYTENMQLVLSYLFYPVINNKVLNQVINDRKKQIKEEEFKKLDKIMKEYKNLTI